jgi:hypothetical protein
MKTDRIDNNVDNFLLFVLLAAALLLLLDGRLAAFRIEGSGL